MMRTPDPRYGITVHVTTFEENGGTRADWDAQLHRSIDIRSSVDRALKDQFARDELHVAFRWCAGVLARAALRLDDEIADYEKRQGHHCNFEYTGVRCGYWWEEGVIDFRSSVDGWHMIPEVSLWVPTERAEEWAKRFQHRIADMLASDQAPLDSAPHIEPGHGPIVLTEPAADARRATT